jgi:hypothetical protein
LRLSCSEGGAPAAASVIGWVNQVRCCWSGAGVYEYGLRCLKYL